MKEEDESGKSSSSRGDGAHSSKRLRLSIPRPHSRRHAAGSSHVASSSNTTVNLPSISYRGVQLGATDHADVTLVSDHTFRDNAATDDGAIEGITERITEGISEVIGEGDDALDLPCDAPDDGANEQERQIGDGAVELVPGAELVGGSDAPVDDPLSFREDEADGALQGDGPRNHVEQEADLASVPEEVNPEVGPPVSQQQDETSSHNVVESGQIVEAQEIQSVPVVELSEDDDEEAQSEEPMLTASAFAEPSLTADDFDAFAPVAPQSILPEAEAGASNPEQLGTQLDAEGITCPICMEPWTSTGNHRICSLACGHLFGKACIKRWLKMTGRKQGKCPQCNKRARVEDLRTLYVARISVMDGESQHYMEEAGSLRTENEKLKQQVVDLREEVRRTQALLRALARDQRDAFTMFGGSGPRHRGHDMAVTAHHIHIAGHGSRLAPRRITPGNANQDQQSGQSRPNVLQLLSMRSTDASRPIPEDQRRLDGRNAAGMIVDLEQRGEETVAARPIMRSFDSQHLEEGFVLQDERSLNGAKVFDMDSHSQLLLVSGRPPDSLTSSGLTKMSLSALSEGECINLPLGTGAIRDIRIAPSGTRAPGKLALVASLGKKLSLFSLESNNVVTAYTLPSPSWACAWDPCDPNRVYTGLQNGTLLTFDVRQTSSPLDTLKGPSSTPIHTLQYVPRSERAASHEFEGSGLLSASSSTFLYWPAIDQPREKRPVHLPQPGASSVCVSVSYNPAADTTVASFRPKPTTPPTDAASSSTHSQTDLLTQPTPPSPCIHIPTHFSYTRTTSWEQQQGAMVGHRSQTVLSRTAMVREWEGEPGNCLFAAGDEGSNAVWLWDMATRAVKQTLAPHPGSPVLDIRSVCVAAGVDLLGCISERTLQLYRRVSR